MLQILTKYLRPDSDTIHLEGTDLSGISLREFARKAAIVHRKNTAPEDLTVERLVSCGRLPYSSMFRVGLSGENREQVEILQLVERLNREEGITIVMVLHDINQALAYSDEVIGLLHGTAAMQGPPDEVITSESIRALYGIDLPVIRAERRLCVMAV